MAPALPDLGIAFPDAIDVVRLAASSPRRTVATAESCTGGLLGAAITSVPGSSRVYLGGLVVYSNLTKLAELGVPAELLQSIGAVSPQVAASMAASVRLRLGATYGIGITGVAGPGFSERKPAGLIHVGVAGPHRTVLLRLTRDQGRHINRTSAVTAALQLLADELRR